METRRKKANEELLILSNYLKGNVANNNGLQLLELDTSIGSGQVHCVCLDNGLIAMEFDLLLYQDCDFPTDWANGDLVYLFYCLKGNCFHKFENDERVTKLEELQTAVLFNDDYNQSKMLLKKDERLVLNCIRVDLAVYENDENITDGHLEEGLSPLLKSYNKEFGNFHIGKFNLEIGELIKSLENAKFAISVSTLLHFKGICHMVLAKQLEQFKDDMENSTMPVTSLLKQELEMISEISDFIRNYPEVQHRIDTISSKSGLSPSKLQLGFKFMHNMTLGEFIRDVRLKKGEHLLRTTDLNISEVVYSIGFTSRSYFCKIFKKKYGCNPKAYKNRAVAALELQKKEAF
ncbi:helix-turn-helix domain-containing protein [Maribacter sp. 2210JD10-5]|uniref:helix-turn-helix domain-containing protein n=1 Tax=Maribacter sp. 2210JD10-5 TaxID=3386272 RepID=UPI0039BD6031